MRCVSFADIEWLFREAVPKFTGKGKSGNGHDTSRSGAAFRAGAILRDDGASYEEMREALLEHEDPDIAEWARTKGLANNERELKRIYGKTSDKTPTLTEDALALIFAARRADDMRFIAAWSKWLSWDGAHWEPDDTLACFDEARAICREKAAGAKPRTAAVHRLRQDRRRRRASGKIRPPDRRDDRPMGRSAEHLQHQGGKGRIMTIELTTGVDRPPDPLDYCTKVAGCTVASEGTPCPMWMAFLNRVTNGNADLIGFLKRFLGYCLTGYVHEHVLVFLSGPAATARACSCRPWSASSATTPSPRQWRCSSQPTSIATRPRSRGSMACVWSSPMKPKKGGGGTRPRSRT